MAILSKTMREKVIPATILGGSVGLKAIGGFQQASNIEYAGKANAQAILDSAAIKAHLNEVEAANFERQANRLQGKNQNIAAGSGFAMSGSLIDAMADTAAQLELQKKINAWSNKVEQSQMAANAANTKNLAKAQATQSRMSAFADLAKGLYTLTDLF